MREQSKNKEVLYKQGELLRKRRRILSKSLNSEKRTRGETSPEATAIKSEIARIDDEIIALKRLAEVSTSFQDGLVGWTSRGEQNPQVGFLFGRVGLTTLLMMLFAAIWFEKTVMAVFICLVLVVVSFSRLWSRFSLLNVACRRSLDEERVFPGERINLTIRLTNRKVLPLPWIQLEDEIPSTLTGAIPFAAELYPGRSTLTIAASLLWYTGLTWRYTLTCSKRGYYTLGPMTVTSGDILGLYPRSERRDLTSHLIVYPRLYPVNQFKIASRYPLGETRTERYIFQDPTRTIGVRDYTAQDSLRFIHWKASAHHQKLEVKVFEPSTTLRISLFLAIDSFSNTGKTEEENLELGVSTAASIARFVIDNRNQVGLHVNAHFIGGGDDIRVSPGSDTPKLIEVLEALARVTEFPSRPFIQLLEKEKTRLPWGTTLVLIMARLAPELLPLLTDLKEKGYMVAAIIIGRPEADLNGWPCVHVNRPDDLKSLLMTEATR